MIALRFYAELKRESEHKSSLNQALPWPEASQFPTKKRAALRNVIVLGEE